MNRFSSLHPAVLALYFLSVLCLTMFTMHPIPLLAALLSGIAFLAVLLPRRMVLKSMAFYLPLCVVVALTNPLFSHNGITPLFFLNGNPVTLEAVLYGVDIGVMLVAVLCWFQCVSLIMTQDKWLFLIGKVSPKLSLVLTAALRFVPLSKAQATKIRNTQKAMGLFASDGWWDKLRGTLRVFSALMTWSLENAVDTGSSMKARGYGLKGRTHFSLFRFSLSDGLVLCLIAILDAVVLFPMVMGCFNFDFYPQMSPLDVGIYALPAYVAFGMLAFLPCILEGKEAVRWTYYKSKM